MPPKDSASQSWRIGNIRELVPLDMPLARDVPSGYSGTGLLELLQEG